MNSYRKAGALFGITFIVYFLTRSLWLDEWDSVQFALGVHDFNLWKHQPHPPGYPLYIFAAKLLVSLGLGPVNALVVIGCATGALFVATWFLIVREEFGDRFAALVAVALSVTPVVWMTATKALTDIPAAGFISLQLLFVTRYKRTMRRRDLILSAVFGAVACGIRPQVIAISIVILLTALWIVRARAREWGLSLGILLATCALWFVPTCYSQVRADPHEVDALAYPHQLLKQWRWRLDKPEVYVAAEGLDAGHLSKRMHLHFGNWISHGFGLATHGVRRGGRILLAAGAILFFLRARKGHAFFWRLHIPWALLYIAIIFCCLPDDTRYYAVIFPLLWIIILGGWWSLNGRWRALAVVPIALMLWISIPLAYAGHREPPPPVEMMEFLEQRHPAKERGRVWLMLGGTRRHANWYAPDFRVSHAKSYAIDGPSFRQAAAIYTDTTNFPREGVFTGVSLELVATFDRSRLIYPKHSHVELFQIRKSEL